jgi:hypothetical protein
MCLDCAPSCTANSNPWHHLILAMILGHNDQVPRARPQRFVAIRLR